MLHGPQVWALTRAMCGPAQAEELTALVFASLADAPNLLATDPTTLGADLLASAHKLAVGRLRADSGRRRHTQTSVEAERDVIASVGVETRRLLWRLPRVERQVIVLAYFGGHTNRQVAEIVDRPAGKVADQLRAGLHRLQAVIAAKAGPSVDGAAGDDIPPEPLSANLVAISKHLSAIPSRRDRWSVLADLAVNTIEGCDFAHIVVLGGHRSASVASADVVAEVDSLQRQAGEGPSFDTVTYNQPVYVADLAHDPDWPRFGPEAAARGIRSLLAIPLAAPSGGVFNLYGRHPDAFSAQAWAAALVLAGAAGLGRSSPQRRQDWQLLAESLRSGLRSTQLIAQAQGVRLEREHLNTVDAVDMLHDATALVASALVEPGDRTAPPSVEHPPARSRTHRRSRMADPGGG